MPYLTLNRLPQMVAADDMFRELWSAASGAASDLYETPEAVVAELSVPGSRPEDIKVSITGDTLTVSGESHRAEEGDEQREYYYKEVRYGRFSQSLTLPVAVKGDEAKASFENGMLKIVLPKAEEAKPKQIEITVPGQAS
jgi:HSP20 family protein